MNDSGLPLAFPGQPRVVHGAGSVGQLGRLVRELGGTRVLLVTDRGLEEAGHAGRARGLLEEAGMMVALFDEVVENPTTREVDACLAVARAHAVDIIVGLGGGSSMDTAKGCNFLLSNGGKMKDYWGVGKATQPMLPLVAVPTTAGTGSECQSFALIADAETHMKMACGDKKAMARVSILDPELTVTQPRTVTACTGVDTITHAVESAVTRKRTAASWVYSRESFRLANQHLERVMTAPGDLEARGAMQLAAAYGGTAIEMSMLGAAHSSANPLTAHFGVVHGLAVGMMLPVVVEFNAEDVATAEIYRELAVYAGLAGSGESRAQAVRKLVQRLGQLLEACGMNRTVSSFGVRETDVPMLAKEAAGQWTAQFNPRPIAAPDFEALYHGVW